MDLGNGDLIFFRVLLHCRWVFSWSVYLCQCVEEALFKTCHTSRKSVHRLMIVKASYFCRNVRQKGVRFCVGCVYVDHIGVLSTSRSRAEGVMGKLTTTFDDAGASHSPVFRSVTPNKSPLGQFLDRERRPQRSGSEAFFLEITMVN